MMANKKPSYGSATILRNPHSILEKCYWKFAEKELKINEDIAVHLTNEWIIFSDQLSASLSAKLKDVFIEDDLEGFWDPKPVGELFKDTSLFKTDIDIVFTLNDKPVYYKNGTAEFNKREFVFENTIYEVSEACIDAMIITSENPQSKHWKYIHTDNRMSGVLFFTFDTGQFNFNIYPAFKNVDGTFLMLRNGESSDLMLWSTDLRLSLANKSNPGFFELIKFCKLLIIDWNDKNPEAYITPSVFETVVYQVQSKTMRSGWLDTKKGHITFFVLFDQVLLHFLTCVEAGFIPSLNNEAEYNLIKNFPMEAKERLKQWCNNIPKYNDKDRSLLDYAKSIWETVSKEPTRTSDDNNDNNNAGHHRIGFSVQHAPSISQAMKVKITSILQALERRWCPLSQVLEAESQWDQLCPILDSIQFWRKLAAHKLMQVKPHHVERYIYSYYHNPQFSPSRTILTDWEHKPEASLKNFLEVLKEIDCEKALEVIIPWIPEHLLQPRSSNQEEVEEDEKPLEKKRKQNNEEDGNQKSTKQLKHEDQ